MKVALCTETVFPIYGVERRVYEMAKRLPKYGIEPTVITSLGKEFDPALDIIKASNPTIITPPKRNYGNCLSYSFNTARFSSSKYDIIDANGHMALFPCFISSKISGKPIVATIHDIYGSHWNTMYKSRASFMGKYIERTLCRLPYTKLIALNRAAKNKFIDMGVPESRLSIIYSGIDTKKIDSIKCRKKDPNSVVYVGRLAPQKNLDILMKAFSMLKCDATLKIIGEGSEYGNLKSMAKSLGVEVDFVGSVSNENAIKEMKKASILVLTSSRENFGIVPLEAMRCMTAVISTKTEGPVDYIDDGKNGLLVDIGNVAQTAEKIDMLLSNNKLLHKIQKEGFETAAAFDWEQIVKSISKIYKEILR